jgi:hypothetical protein
MEVSGQLYAPAALPPVPILCEAGRAPEPVWTLCRIETSLALQGNELRSLGHLACSPVTIPTELSRLTVG